MQEAAVPVLQIRGITRGRRMIGTVPLSAVLEQILISGSKLNIAITSRQTCSCTKHERRLARVISERPSRALCWLCGRALSSRNVPLIYGRARLRIRLKGLASSSTITQKPGSFSQTEKQRKGSFTCMQLRLH